MTERHYLGIDGRGTHTRALLVDSAGVVRGSGRAGSTNRNHHTRDEVRDNMRAAIVAATNGVIAIGDLSGMFLGMCGVSTDADRADIVSIVREIDGIHPSMPVAVENDTLIGLTGGLSGRSGIVLIAGTGSACFGMNADRRSALCGGWGALADDSGSAPWIGLRAISAAVRSEDGRIGRTALRDIAFDYLGLRDPRELIDRVHNRGLSREEIGMLAPLVIEAHMKGDFTATSILHDAAAELAAMVATVAIRLFNNEPFELILVGGLALSGDPFQPLLIDTIRRVVPTVRVTEPEMSPVHGAALEAIRADKIPWSADIVAHLRAHHNESHA